MPYRKRGSRVKQKHSPGSQSSGERRNATILFVDIIGCSEISNHLSPKRYHKEVIKPFQNYFREVCKFYRDKVYDTHEHVLFDYDLRGDEGCLKIFVGKKDGELARDIDVAISIALDLKRQWMLTDYNKNHRIKQGVLPVDLAVGIHFGQVSFEDGDAEGYAINLAKRIETHSREGSFTHILLSEAAFAQFYHLKDEPIYKFDESFIIKPKGISHTIRVFELKHHYLPTDWQDTIEAAPLELSMVFKKKNSAEVLNVIEKAYRINPTNLWLAEEYIYFKLADLYLKNPNPKKNEYETLLDIVRQIARIGLEDATLLTIWGQVLGEKGDYVAEEKKYRAALELDKSDGNVHWYLGLCISYQLQVAYKKSRTSLKKFYDDNYSRITEVLEEYREAIDLKPMNPWIVYDYACELSWWSQVNEKLKKMAVEKLLEVLKLDLKLKKWIKREDYLKPIINDPKIKPWLR